jgi:hypothetical protein
MKKKILIINEVPCHQEIIETVILQYYKILNISEDLPVEIFLSTNELGKKKRLDFESYIEEKYPEIKFQEINDYDYYINCTIYQKNLDTGLKIDKNVNSNKKYIAHEVTNNLKSNPNIFFLTPLAKERFFYADKLPFSEKKEKSKVPIYIIQGALIPPRRNFELLRNILEKKYKYDFKIKLIGWGRFPNLLKKYENKIILKNNLSFKKFHKEFLDGYCILPLISKKKHPHYYKNKLTSTINYARGYNLKCLIDKDLQDIYNLNDVEIYNDENDITIAFEKTLEDFYK